MSDRWKSTVVWGFLIVFFGLVLWDSFQTFVLIVNPLTFDSRRLQTFMGILVSLTIILGYGFWASLRGHFPYKAIQRFSGKLNKINIYIRGILAFVILSFPAFLLLYSPVGDFNPGTWFRIAAIFICSFCTCFILFPIEFDVLWFLKLSLLIMLSGAIFTTADWLKDVTSYPFSLSWSEGNRIWDYSMLFGSSRYINPTGKPIFTFIETGRQFLWAIPFLIPGLNILSFRLWDVLVWILPPMILGACSVFQRPFFRRYWIWQVGFVIWVYVFLSQGPIYSPLLLGAALVVLASRQRKLWIKIIAVAFAAYYLRISRFTWMYAPGLWAGMLALLAEEQPSFSLSGWKKLINPFILGISGYLGAEFLLPLINSLSGGPAQSASSVISEQFSILGVQALLWDRLLPNPTFSQGILLGTLWVGAPIMLWIYWTWKAKIWKPNWMQGAAVISLCAAFMGLGFLASVKIGGGSNLHNLDMLWVTLVILAGWIWNKWMSAGFPHFFQIKGQVVILCLAMIFPAFSLIQYATPLRLPPESEVQKALEIIQKKVGEAQTKGPVLFMDQRQLITFGYISNLPLTVEYEKKYLMEQAMSKNAAYLEEFRAQLESKKYPLIVTIPIRDVFAHEDRENFAEENNAWADGVSKPLIKYYEPYITLEEFGIQLLVPRKHVNNG
jgi:hypothetical protein